MVEVTGRADVHPVQVVGVAEQNVQAGGVGQAE
jgi:hypothetical protein